MQDEKADKKFNKNSDISSLFRSDDLSLKFSIIMADTDKERLRVSILLSRSSN